jgi:hypothetical protein
MKQKYFMLSLSLLVIFVVALAAGTGPRAQAFGPRAQYPEGTPTSWAGYVVETNLTTPQNGSVTDVKGDWVVPFVGQTAGNTYSAVWVGIDGYNPFPGTVEQIGTEQDYYKGAANYYAWYELYPAACHVIKYAVSPGDQMSAEVAYSNGKFTLTLTDVGRWTFTTSQSLNKALCNSAEWIVEAPGNIILPLAEFGTVNFSNASATINNHSGTISDASWQDDAITIVSYSGAVEATPLSLTNDGASFSVIRAP